MSDAVQLEDVHKSFGRTRCCAASTSLSEHEVVCLIGASGSGKSTLLRCVNLLEPIDEGRIVVDGVELTAPGLDVNRSAAGSGSSSRRSTSSRTCACSAT